MILKTSQRQALAEIGDRMGPDTLAACRALFGDEQEALAARYPAAVSDLAYGPDERHRLDVYRPHAGGSNLPVLVFVHGGGFVLGDKGGAESWTNANVGRMAAAAGFVGIVINYRLAPTHVWPAGGEDVGTAVDWLKAHAADHGGDPNNIFLIGTSAGAIHVAAHLQLRSKAPLVRGAILLSGLYGFTPLEQRDFMYYGEAESYAERAPLEAVISTRVPLLVACAQRDPARFQSEFVELLRARLERHGSMPRSCILSHHNHYSLSMHLGTADRRLSDEIADFVEGESSQ